MSAVVGLLSSLLRAAEFLWSIGVYCGGGLTISSLHFAGLHQGLEQRIVEDVEVVGCRLDLQACCKKGFIRFGGQ